jgi:hypothetical protein
MRKKISHSARILRLLKEQGSATNAELNRICFRYCARLHELRGEGHIIITNRIKAGLFIFVYKGHPDDKAAA